MAQMLASPAAHRTAEIIAHATVALDGQENAMHWLQQPNVSLANRKPIDVLFGGTPAEAQQVDDLLSALENGIFM